MPIIITSQVDQPSRRLNTIHIHAQSDTQTGIIGGSAGTGHCADHQVPLS